MADRSISFSSFFASFSSASSSAILSSAQLWNFLNSLCIRAASVSSKYFNRPVFTLVWCFSITSRFPLKSPWMVEFSPKINRQISSFKISSASVTPEKSNTEWDSISDETSKLLILNMPDLDFRLLISECFTFILLQSKEIWARGVFSFLPWSIIFCAKALLINNRLASSLFLFSVYFSPLSKMNV